MTVVFREEDEQRFTAQDTVQAKEELVKAIVRDALVSRTDAFIDMLCDCHRDMKESELTRAGIQAALGSIKGTTADFLDNVLSDLKDAVLDRLKEANYGAIVTGIKYNLAGEIVDVDVDVTVS